MEPAGLSGCPRACESGLASGTAVSRLDQATIARRKMRYVQQRTLDPAIAQCQVSRRTEGLLDVDTKCRGVLRGTGGRASVTRKTSLCMPAQHTRRRARRLGGLAQCGHDEDFAERSSRDPPRALEHLHRTRDAWERGEECYARRASVAGLVLQRPSGFENAGKIRWSMVGCRGENG